MAIAVVFQDEVVYLKGFGVRQSGKEEPVDADTVFQIASASNDMLFRPARTPNGKRTKRGFIFNHAVNRSPTRASAINMRASL
jgi:hypothetical protein